MTLHLKAETEDAGTRLDAFVASRANGLTRSQAARYIDEGRVSVDGKPASKSCRISGGETVTVDVPEVRETALEPQDIPLDVVYEDEEVKDYPFGCNFSRHATIEPLLKVFEATGTIETSIHGRKIWIRKRK